MIQTTANDSPPVKAQGKSGDRVIYGKGGWSYYEYKYLVSPAQVGHTRAVLDSLYGGTDPFPADWVNSVYFDTITRRCYVESESGEECKRKFRLRGYGDGPYIRAQVKEKSLSAVFKRSVPIDPVTRAPSTWPTLPTDSPMCSEIRSIASEYGPMHTVVRIRYFRRRYRVFDYRVTLDERISAEVCGPHIGAVRSFVQFPINVLEVKVRSDRPYLPGLGRLNLGLSSFSKFLLGLTLLEGKPEALNKYR